MAEPSLPETYKAVVIDEKNGPLTLKELPLQRPKQGELLVKVLATGVCFSDANVQRGHMGDVFPVTPGHEVIGDVVALGPGESHWKVGDRVGAQWHGGHDGVCRECQQGQFQLCRNAQVTGAHRNGGYAEYMLARTEAAVHVPSDVDPAAFAPMLCAGVTTFNSMRNMGIKPGSLVAIQGLGGLGHLAIQFAVRMGFRVVALSSSAGKEDFARRLGASHYIDSSKQNAAEVLAGMGGAALILTTIPGSPEIIEPLIHGLRPHGTLCILGPMEGLSLNTTALLSKNLSVRGWLTGTPLDAEETIEFARQNQVDCMIEKFPLKDYQQAYDRMLSGQVRFRSVLVMEA